MDDQIVDGVAGDPKHGGEGHDEADAVRPEGVLHVAVLDRWPADDVEEEDRLKIFVVENINLSFV